MDGSPVDLIALRERTDRIAELHHERRKAGLARMEEFLTLLTPEQAKAIRKLRPEQLIPPPPARPTSPKKLGRGSMPTKTANWTTLNAKPRFAAFATALKPAILG